MNRQVRKQFHQQQSCLIVPAASLKRERCTVLHWLFSRCQTVACACKLVVRSGFSVHIYSRGSISTLNWDYHHWVSGHISSPVFTSQFFWNVIIAQGYLTCTVCIWFECRKPDRFTCSYEHCTYKQKAKSSLEFELNYIANKIGLANKPWYVVGRVHSSVPWYLFIHKHDSNNNNLTSLNVKNGLVKSESVNPEEQKR